MFGSMNVICKTCDSNDAYRTYMNLIRTYDQMMAECENLSKEIKYIYTCYLSE